MTRKILAPLEDQLPALAEALRLPLVSLQFHLRDLRCDAEFIGMLNREVATAPSFDGTRFVSSREFRAWREALYVLVRAMRPRVVIETGVHHGFSTALILRAIQKNGHEGALFSLDLDPADEDYRKLDKSLRTLPPDRLPGWIVPDELRGAHALLLQPSRMGLRVLEDRRPDIFIHDSDHGAANVLHEILWAWERLPKDGLLVVDNTEESWGVVSDFLSRRLLARYHTIVNVSAPPEARWETTFVMKG